MSCPRDGHSIHPDVRGRFNLAKAGSPRQTRAVARPNEDENGGRCAAGPSGICKPDAVDGARERVFHRVCPGTTRARIVHWNDARNGVGECPLPRLFTVSPRCARLGRAPRYAVI